MAQGTRPLALVTGASTGIGYELAKICAQNEFDLVVVADEPKIEDAAREFHSRPKPPSQPNLSEIERELESLIDLGLPAAAVLVGARQVIDVAPLHGHRVDQFGATGPQRHLVARVGQHQREGRAPGPGTQNGDPTHDPVTGRPVQLMLERSAENLASGNRNATRQKLRLGAKRDGRLTAIDVRIDLEQGAYSVGGEDSDVIGTYLTLYRCANVRAEQTALATHLGPAVAFRAPGYAEGNFALESAIDELAERLDMDAIDLRLRNYSSDDQREGKPFTSRESLRRCMARAAQAIEWQRKRPGIGFAAHDWAAGGGWPPAEARVEFRSGKARVIVGVQDIGTGSRTALAQIAAEALAIPCDAVEVELGDTAPGLYGPTSAGSATLATLGPAIYDAARAAKEQGSAVAKRRDNPKDRSIRTCGAQAVELSVDRDTGEVIVKRVVAAHDSGRIVNPLLHTSQVIGGISQALGYALSEERIVDARLGEVLNANLEEYKVPTVADIPEIINASESMPDTEANPTGAKGCGEPPIIPTAAAIANAVHSATGLRIRELPITRDKLINRMR